MKSVVKLSSIELALLIVSIIPLSIIPHQVQVITKYIVTLYLLCKYLLSFKNIKQNKVIIILILIYTMVLSYSTHINIGSFTWTMSAFMTGMQYLTMFLLFFDFAKTRGIEIMVKNLSYIIGTLIFFNDFLMPIVKFDTGIPDQLYLLGNKFSVSYLHCMLGVLAYVRQKDNIKKIGYVIWFLFSAFISLVVDCSTGLVMSLSLIFMIFLPNFIKEVMSLPLAFPVALGIENVLIWGSTNLFKQPWVTKIITDVLHKSEDITGRERLYNITFDLVREKPWFGYGHVTDIYRNTFGYGNAQNGLFHIVTQAGIVGAAIYFFMVTYALLNKKKGDYIYGIYMFVFAMLIGSAVEINLSEIFLIAVAVIYAYQRAPLIAQKENAQHKVEKRKLTIKI